MNKRVTPHLFPGIMKNVEKGAKAEGFLELLRKEYCCCEKCFISARIEPSFSSSDPTLYSLRHPSSCSNAAMLWQGSLSFITYLNTMLIASMHKVTLLVKVLEYLLYRYRDCHEIFARINQTIWNICIMLCVLSSTVRYEHQYRTYLRDFRECKDYISSAL